MYTVNHKKVAEHFMIITLENLDGFFYNFCTVVSRKKYFIYTLQKFPPLLNNVLTLPSENENIIFHTFIMHSSDITTLHQAWCET